jgi:hypothetical protein
MKRVLIFITAMQVWVYSYSQFCGTYLQQDQMDLEATINITAGTPTQSLPQVNKDLSVSVYLVMDTGYNVGITQARVQSLIDSVNLLFAPINLKFHICSFANVSNYQLDNLTTFSESDLTVSNYTRNTINLYFVSNINDMLGNLTDGYTYFPATNKDFIFLKKSALYVDLAHQLGHFFGVYHTHEKLNRDAKSLSGNELVARTNCDKLGDLCCDTEADPNIHGLYDANCIYTGMSKDTNGDFYKPTAQNMMSFGGKKCRSYFTRTQYLRVIYGVNNLKAHLR